MMVSLVWKWQLLQKMIADPNLSAASLRVAARLLEFMNGQTGQCDPSIGTLADRLGLARASVKRAAAQLEALGYLARQRRCDETTGSNRSSAFTFDFRRVEECASESMGGFKSEPRDGLKNEPRGGRGNEPTPRLKSEPGMGSEMSPKPMNNNQIDISRDFDLLGEPRGSADDSETATTAPSGLKASKRTRTEAAAPEGWETFRARYPRRPGARWSDARRHFEKLLRGGTKPDTIIAGCEAYAGHVAKRGTAPEFVEDPSNWLSRRRFDDDFGEPAISTIVPAEANAANWGVLLKRFHETGGIDGGGYWPAALGPAPGTRGCRVPPQLLEQFRKEAA